MPDPPSITIFRTIYDTTTKNFVTSSPDVKALPNTKEWINKKREEEKARLRKQNELHEKLAKEGNSIGMKFIHIPAGEFMMGSDEYGDGEIPVHEVNISKPFYLGTYPVTQCEWKMIMEDNPSEFKGDNLPVERVSWDDVQEFIRKLNAKEGTDKYRLPSEAEWEYAARSGTITRYSFGDDEGKLGEYAWYSSNSNCTTHPFGQKKPNSWGLYDMHGNVWEWVQDWYHSDYTGAPTDGSAWEKGGGSARVFRGGGWNGYARNCRSAIRYYVDTGLRGCNLGFRLLRAP